MAIVNEVVKVMTKPVPRVISPKTHSIADLITAGMFLVGAGLFWRRNKRASVAALVCGGAHFAVAMLTDYPGGVDRVIRYGTHRNLDLGLAAMFATMPDFFAFSDEPERKFFLLQGAIVTALAETTEFPEAPPQKENKTANAA
jgi:lysylphosphatidylglycerol synthetase-like protein (DUF2156 family)